jgi:hypothetical protein
MNATKSPVLETVERTLSGALTLADASLVIFRHGVLVEFKTEMLVPGLAETSEGKYRGWQIGPFEGHHCHLDLAAVTEVWFDAEAVSCQGGRLNYTVWFLADRDCGNPFRSSGLFSVTLNAPYQKDGTPRIEVIAPVYALYDLLGDAPGLSASSAFAAARPLAPGERAA